MKNHTLTRRAFGALSLSAGVALAQPVWSKAEAPGYTFPHLLVEPDELAALMTEAPAKTVLVDVRIREEYDAGHIAGAAHVDPSAVVASHSPVDGSLKPIGALEMLLGGLGVTAERRVILYDDRGGFHAARMFWLLEYLGHRNVAVLNGGYSGWAKAGGETSSTAPTVDPGVFHAAPSPRRFASAQ
ncbi:MAG: rhodanese-like domain-containing protein, partial [Pseudomonadota bacterium]